MEFYDSSNFLAMKGDALVMTEETSSEDKESFIKNATSSGQVGLFTKEFGRGTDFYCRDEIVLVLCDKSLEKFLITKEDIQNARNSGEFYPMLNKKRDEFFKTQYAESKKFVTYASKQHELGEQIK
ncbi:hypothetical protein RFI_40223 [Reticulomyxa filosa]|uniref:Uncharacterized protein n=1 Tax=Reticulomyxa filosa TaxID=46433 RepID=X6L7J8_RETFI|nr:hypothetical protein RFI_40223 [Reticulomyxa filosa]|eukprot:ETN97308.1 hypothetical protein RFI_40223 [Reticulomyxa filosa]